MTKLLDLRFSQWRLRRVLSFLTCLHFPYNLRYDHLIIGGRWNCLRRAHARYIRYGYKTLCPVIHLWELHLCYCLKPWEVLIWLSFVKWNFSQVLYINAIKTGMSRIVMVPVDKWSICKYIKGNFNEFHCIMLLILPKLLKLYRYADKTLCVWHIRS
jgi:hypothetical protein